jgi:TPR repeat protein
MEVKGCQIDQIVRIDYGHEFIMTPDYYGKSIENGTKKEAGSPLSQIRWYKNTIKDPLERTKNHNAYPKQFFFYMQSAVILPFITKADWIARGFDQYTSLTENIIFKEMLQPSVLKNEMVRIMATTKIHSVLKETFDQLAITILRHQNPDIVPTCPDWIQKNSNAQIVQADRDTSSDDSESVDLPNDAEALRALAKAGDAEAQYEYAWLVADGKQWKEPENLKSFLYWLETAAENGSNRARNNFGRMLCDGVYVLKDVQRGLKFLKLTADEGNNGKMTLDYALKLLSFRDDSESIESGISYLKKAVADGSTRAIYEAAILQLEGDIAEKNVETGFSLLEAAARQGSISAMRELGNRHQKALDTPQNLEEAKKWMRMAALEGDISSMYDLGYIHYLKNEFVDAAEWYQRAADLGNLEAQIKTALAYMANDRGRNLDHYRAIEYLRMAVEQGHDYAMIWLADYYKEGLWIEKNHKEALKLYTMAAQKNNSFAQYKLYVIFKYGDLGSKDDTEAFRWLKLSAENGNLSGKVYLGLYYEGEGLIDKAVKLYKEAADAGDDMGRFQLGLCYWYGNGLKRNKKEGLRLIQLAANDENDNALTFLRKKAAKSIFGKISEVFS